MSIINGNFIFYKVIDTLSSNFGHPHYETFEDYSRCFNKQDDDFDVENDIFEIRHGSDWVSKSESDGADIHVSIIDHYSTISTKKNLLFGRNHDLDWILIDSPAVWNNLGHAAGDGNYCLDDKESAASIEIQNGIIIESECPPGKTTIKNSNLSNLKNSAGESNTGAEYFCSN